MLDIIIFDKNTQKGEFINHGYGKLRFVEKCEITEELNGRYDLEIVASLMDPKVKYITKWSILMVEGQLFRVVSRIDNDFDMKSKIFARHIFYDINFGFVEDQRANQTNVKDAMIKALPVDFSHFELSSDIDEINTLYFVKNNGVESMLAIIERWGQGELIRDNFNITINKMKGRDSGVTFTYKKIDAIEITENTDEVVTRLYPTGKDGVSLEEKYIDIPNWNDDEYPPFHITREVKFEGAENQGDLRILAQRKAKEIGLSRVSFSIKVHDLANTSLYKNMSDLMNVEVGDLVTVKHSKLNVRVKVKCIKKVRDLVTGETVEEFGKPLGNFFDNISNSNIKIDMPDTTQLRNELFYYYNAIDVNLTDGKSVQLASIKLATSVQTNLMCHVTLNPHIIDASLLKMRLTLNNINIPYSPIVTLNNGYNLVSFTIPLIAVEGGQTQTLKLWGELDGNGTFEPNSVHLSVSGQNIALGLIKIEPFTGASFNHTITKPLLGKMPVNVKFKCNNININK